ncbi:hypothetical protein UA08_06817 [Talaromyces atroroseus]|uniref:Fungal N-terminal domain-containing protein n=1 Tax=Talaromyces atroroseus TaxID=1441469 RepID=A0A225AR84_TALAT|nr:hypothetical protein UA08_06817 [Talaromyces atroroseus]OKL58089.1 hypothetical protein UA08_06817 [Talaromyces atroroseus]
MDPISVISLASSIAGLIDVTSHSIISLLNLASRYSRFGLKIRQIAGQLSTLKAALKKIKDLIEISHDEVPRKNGAAVFALDDEQLVCDLLLSIDCCESVIKVLDEQLSRFQLSSHSQSSGLSDVRSKVKFLWEEGDMNEYQGMLNNQINALNLLLTVTQCESLMEQGNVLRRKSSRLVFEQVKDDTSSLLLQRDRESFLSRQSSAIDDGDFIDTEFGFDRDLFSSKAYRTVAMSSMRQSILLKRKNKSSTIITAAPPVNTQDDYVSDTASAAQGDRIEVMVNSSLAVSYSPLPKISEQASEANKKPKTKAPSNVALSSKSHERRPSRLLAYPRLGRRIVSPPSVQPTESTISTTQPSTANLLLLGCSASGKSTAVKAIHLATGRFNEYPSPTRLGVVERLVSMVEENIVDTSRSPEIDQLRKQCEKVREGLQIVRYRSGSTQTEDTLPNELKALWNEVKASGLLDKLPASVLDQRCSYFSEAIDRVTQDDYTPNIEDTLWNHVKTTGIFEMRLDNQKTGNNKDFMEVKIIDVGGRRSERKKWIHTFSNVSILFFFIDISGYDESLAEDEYGNKMQESFMLFDSLSQGRYPEVYGEEAKEDLHTVEGVRDYYTRQFLELAKVYKSRLVSVHYTSIYEPAELGNIFLHNAYAVLHNARADPGSSTTDVRDG